VAKGRMINRHRQGYIYLIRRADGWYKIGRTANLYQRMRVLRWEKGRQHRLVLLSLIKVDDQIMVEKLLHHIFATKRTAERYRGMGAGMEWFLLSNADLFCWATWADIIGEKVIYMNICLTEKNWLAQLRGIIDGWL